MVMPTIVLWLNRKLAKMPNASSDARPGREDLLSQQVGPRARWPAPAGEARRHQRGEPGFVLQRQHEPDHRADHEAERRDQDVPAGGAHCGRQILREERPQAGERARCAARRPPERRAAPGSRDRAADCGRARWRAPPTATRARRGRESAAAAAPRATAPARRAARPGRPAPRARASPPRGPCGTRCS